VFFGGRFPESLVVEKDCVVRDFQELNNLEVLLYAKFV